MDTSVHMPVPAQTFDPAGIVARALGLIKTYSIQNDGFEWLHAKEIDWQKYRLFALTELKNSENTRPAVLRILEASLEWLGDKHSAITDHGFLLQDSGAADVFPSASPEKTRPAPMPESEQDELILYLNLPGLSPHSTENDRQKYQSILLDALAPAAHNGTTGIIIDVRGNEGGDPGPMLHGLSPLLGPDVLGYFSGPLHKGAWNVNHGYYAGQTGFKAKRIEENDPANFPLVDMPVALLCGRDTFSAAEFLLLSFRGRPYTLFFGEKTGGASSGNLSFSLTPDKSLMLHVCANIGLDRNGNGNNGGPIYPDVEVLSRPYQHAKEWLNGGALPLTRSPSSRHSLSSLKLT